jgi:hypothetical protein
MSRSVKKTSSRRAKPLSPILEDKEYQPSRATIMLTYGPIKSKPIVTKEVKISTGLGGQTRKRSLQNSRTKSRQTSNKGLVDERTFRKKVLIRKDAGDQQVPVFKSKASRQTI